MRISRFLTIVFIVTSCAVTYIHQQTQILIASYKLQQNQSTKAYLLDCNEALVYNVAEMTSPQHLQEKLVMQNICMHRPNHGQIVRIVKTDTAPAVMARSRGRGFFGFLTPQAQAQALE